MNYALTELKEQHPWLRKYYHSKMLQMVAKQVAAAARKAAKTGRFLTRMLKPLRRAHRRVSRRQLGSSNREKARHMLARLYERINNNSNRRRDFLHKLSSYYSSRYDLIFLEKLRVINMTKNHRLLARKILDASWSLLLKICCCSTRLITSWR